MPKVNDFLQDIGFSETESQIYLYLLHTPNATSNQLLESTSIKRPTLYHALRTLELKQIITRRREGAEYLYQAVPAEKLNDYLLGQSRIVEKQQLELANLLASFPVSAAKDAAPLEVSSYETIEGIKKIVEKALNCKSKEWRIIAPRHNFFFEFDETYANYFMKRRELNRIKARSLWENMQKTTGWRELTLGEFVARKPRYLPEAYTGKFTSVIILFDDSAAFISSLKTHHALLINSAELTNTMKVMFDALWEQSLTN